MTASLEYSLQTCDTYEDFEKNFSTEFLDEDGRVGMYLENLLYKYDRKASVVSFDAHLNPSYVGNIINFKKNNPSRDALICIAFALSASEEELQYLLKYAPRQRLSMNNRQMSLPTPVDPQNDTPAERPDRR